MSWVRIVVGFHAGSGVVGIVEPAVVASGAGVGVPGRVPTLRLTQLPPGWTDEVEVFLDNSADRVELVGPEDRVTITMASSPEGTPGRAVEVDGYPALMPHDDETSVVVRIGRADCIRIELDFEGLADNVIAAVLDDIVLDDSALTDVDEGIRLLDGGTTTPTLFDRGLLARVDADPFVDVVSDAYGPPDDDTGWTAMPAELACTQAEAYRSIFWGDLRVVFERSGSAEQLMAWSVGDQAVPIIAPSHAFEPTRTLGLTTAEGLAVGAPTSVLEQFPLVGDGAAVGSNSPRKLEPRECR